MSEKYKATTLQVWVNSELHKVIKERQAYMAKTIPGWEPSLSETIKSLMADQRLHTLKLVDLLAAKSNLLTEIADTLHELGGRDAEEITSIVKAVGDALEHVANDTSLINAVN